MVNLAGIRPVKRTISPSLGDPQIYVAGFYKAFRADSEKLFGNSGEGLNKSSVSRQEGVKGASYVALPYKDSRFKHLKLFSK
jgi:hypothetical protein